ADPLPARPLDVVVWGGPNLAGLVGRDGSPATPQKAVSPGQSLERSATPGWNPQLAPSPGICRLTHPPSPRPSPRCGLHRPLVTDAAADQRHLRRRSDPRCDPARHLLAELRVRILSCRLESRGWAGS